MKKIIATAVFIGIINCTYGQNALSLDYTIDHNSLIIVPTWSNFVKILFSDMTTFKQTMSKYKYRIATDGSGYIASTPVGTPIYMIRKSNSDVNIIFSEADEFTGRFRKELRQKFSGTTATVEDGFEIYKGLYNVEGVQYRLKAVIKEELNGGSLTALMIF